MNFRYLDGESREIGPVPIEALRVLRAAGAINDTTLVQAEAGGPWSALSALLGPAIAPPAQTAPALEHIKKASGDAWSIAGKVLSDPAIEIPEGWRTLGPQRAQAAGIAMLACVAILFTVLVGLCDAFAFIRPADFGGFLKLLLATIGSLAVWSLATAGAGKLLGGQSGVAGALFVIGNLSLYWAFGLVAYVLLGWKNLEVLGLIALVIGCVNVLQLFCGLTRIDRVSERNATFALPVVIAAGIWGTKIIFSAVFQ
jgi:hypothetical protein